MTEKAERPARRRFPLLVYQGLWEMAFWPGVLVFLGCVAFFLWNPPALQPVRPLWLLGAAAAIALLVSRAWAKGRAWVEIGKEGFRVRVPSRELEVPYGAVHITRPTLLYQHFHKDDLEARGMAPIRPYIGHSAVVVELREWPQPPDWVRRHLGPYFLAADCEGLVLTVEDWLGLHHALDAALEAWRTRHLPPPRERFLRARGKMPDAPEQGV
jgi:hypothetical protein